VVSRALWLALAFAFVAGEIAAMETAAVLLSELPLSRDDATTRPAVAVKKKSRILE
jgi:hypothetical protein